MTNKSCFGVGRKHHNQALDEGFTCVCVAYTCKQIHVLKHVTRVNNDFFGCNNDCTCLPDLQLELTREEHQPTADADLGTCNKLRDENYFQRPSDD